MPAVLLNKTTALLLRLAPLAFRLGWRLGHVRLCGSGAFAYSFLPSGYSCCFSFYVSVFWKGSELSGGGIRGKGVLPVPRGGELQVVL